MKTLLKIAVSSVLIGAVFFFGTSVASAQLNKVQGGTGRSTIKADALLYGGDSIRIATTSTTTVSCAGTVSCTAFTVIGASPFTITGSGAASDNIATSSAETSDRVPFWTSTNATPATLSGGVAGFAFNSTDNRLTVTNASTTAFSSGFIGGTNAAITYASSTALTVSGTLYVGSLTGYLKAASGVVSAQAVPIPIADGGTNATSFTSSTGVAAFNGTSLVNFTSCTLTTSIFTCTNASTTNLSSSAGATFANTSGNVGIGTSTPFGKLAVQSGVADGSVPQFNVGSSTRSQPSLQVTAGRHTATCETKYGATGEPATSTAMTINWTNTCPSVTINIGTSANTIALINATTSNMTGSRKLVTICNPSTTASTVTWSGVEWYGGTAPTQTTTANYCDTYSFHVTSATSTPAAQTYKVGGAQTAGLQ